MENLRKSVNNVLINPRVTEKATFLKEENVYVFNVSPKSNKKDIAEAVLTFYKVTPKKIRVVRIPRKKVFVRGKKGVKSGGKKAYVYLKEGDKIESL